MSTFLNSTNDKIDASRMEEAFEEGVSTRYLSMVAHQLDPKPCDELVSTEVGCRRKDHTVDNM